MKLKKMTLGMLFLCMFMFGNIGTSFARTENVNSTKEVMIVNGKEVEVNTITISNRKLVGVRELGELLGAEVEYYGGNVGEVGLKRKINLPAQYGNPIQTYGSIFTQNPYGNTNLKQPSFWSITAYSSDNANASFFEPKITFDVPPCVIEGKTYLPLRDVANLLLFDVNFDGSKVSLTESKKIYK